ncbi:hypothetical protein ACROYT_G041527 [Oculina patagonica]
MEDGAISDGQITASSQWNANEAAHQGRLHYQATAVKAGSWVAATSDAHQWLQIDLGSRYTKVTRVATQGRNGAYVNWVTKYKLQYSNDGVNFQYYIEPGEGADEEFAGNTDQDTVVYHDLSQPITARYVRFLPVAWYEWTSMRVELYGCRECQEALGMENNAISNGHISASSHRRSELAPFNGRLHFTGGFGAWRAGAEDVNQWLQVDLGSVYTEVTGVATQGRHTADWPMWVTKYKLQYSDDGLNFQYYTEQGQSADKEFVGNTDLDTAVYHDLDPPIAARYVRFRPVTWHKAIAMRVELYGCVAVNIPRPKALYPLNSWFATREIYDEQPQGTSFGVSLAAGPNNVDGGSYQFDGHINSYIQFPNNGGLDVQHSITLLCWLYPENTDGPIFQYGPSTNWGVHMWITAPGAVYAKYTHRDYTETSPLITAQSLALNQWHYVGSSYDHTTGTASIWLNGERVLQQDIGAGMTLATQDDVRMGAKEGDSRYFMGRITAMQVYDAALTAKQINEVKNTGLDKDECQDQTHNCDVNAQCNNTFESFNCTCLQGYSGDGKNCSDVDECQDQTHNCDVKAQCNNTDGSFYCTCIQGYSGDGVNCLDIDECATATHNCHGVANCYNNDGSFTCECRDGYIGDGIVNCEPLGDFSVSIRNISKDKYHSTVVERSAKSVQEALILGLPPNVAAVLSRTLEWRIISEAELAASETAEGKIVSQGTTEWTIYRRSIPAGIYQVKLTASYTIGDPSSPHTLTAFDYGFIEVVPAPVRAIIDGGSSVRWGSVGTVTVDGSLSYDGDIGPGNHTGLNFAWSCLYANDNVTISNDCFGSFVGEVNAMSTAISIDPGLLVIGENYILRLTVLKDERISFAEMSFEIAAGEVPQVALRCFVDCGAVVSASNKLRVTSECPNSPCNGSVYAWRLKRFNDDSSNWEDVPIFPNMTSTAVNATNMVIKKNSLQSKSKYSLALIVTSPEGAEGFAVLEFETAGAPHSGYCTSSVSEGVSLETEFTFKCFDWQDTSSLTYEFQLGEEPISYGSSSQSVSTVLPAGSPEDDYQLQINIVIKNAVGVAVVERLIIKVTTSSSLDLCLSPPDAVATKLKSYVLGEGNPLDEFLNKGELSQAVQLSLSVLKSTNEENDCGQELDPDVKTLISETLIVKFTAITPESLDMSRMIMSVVSAAMGGGQGSGSNSVSLESTMQMTEKTTNMLMDNVKDLEEPFFPVMELTAKSVTECLTNVLQSAAGATQESGFSDENEPSSEFVKKASGKLSNMSDAFFGRLVPAEDLVIKTTNLAISLKKVSADDVKGLGMEEGPSKFKLPGNLGDMGGGNINAKMQAVNFNPFTWDKSSKKVKSSVTSLDLQSGNGKKINVSNLDNDIEIVIPISSPPKNTSNGTKHNFLKPNKMSFRSYYAELADVPVSIKIGAQEEDIVIEMFVKVGSRPTIDDSDHNFTVTSTCSNQTDHKQNKTSCLIEESSVTVVPLEPSSVYVGLLFLGTKNVSEHYRKRRSCFGHGRERRSCVGVKDPPPKGVYKTDVPQYDPLTDVNYTFSITQSSCLYWSEDKEKWTSDGCKVDASSNSTHLKCLCNHLTSFGGNFIQAPNPIDFDKVFTEFTRLGESGNISVLVTIACAFLLYFVVLIFARRADKRDENKICPPKHVAINEGGTYFYDMVISTGVWKHSGTTANVTISIKGEISEHNLIPIRSKGESGDIFARGSINGFVLITNEPLGSFKEITLGHDNSGDNPSWFVEAVVIKDRQTEERWVFPINRWIALEKDDGQIEVTVDSKSPTSFSAQVRSRFGRKIADGHLWMSVFGKACSSTFTRVQRASCCLSVLFSAMIANAMFYNIGGESDGAIQVGPFKFSWKQIVVGVQSGIIVAPVNILIVLLFKSSRPRRKKGNKYKDIDHAQQLVDEISETGCMLPHFFVYVGWFLCFVTTLTAATFTLFYSLMWGKEVAEQWLASILISNGQDIFVVQPTKVMLAVIVISLILSRNKDNSGDSEEGSEQGDPHENDIDFLSDDPKQRFKRYQMEKMRERSKREAQLTVMVREIILHLIFVFLLAIVCYGNKNGNRFLMTTAMRNQFTKFDKVTDSHRLWSWLTQQFLPNIYNQPWYNGLEESNDVYIENKMSILVGMPWMRQLRIKKSSCGSLSNIISNCFYDYSQDGEDTTLLRLPGWKPLPYNTSWPKALEMCPKPWRYQTADELDNDPIKTSQNTYGGGGYPAVLGYDENTASGVLNETIGHGWLDRQTRAVILEFTVFNVNTNLMSIATYFFEVLANGAAYTSRRIETLELYSTESGALMFYLIGQFLFMAMVLYYLIVMLIHLYRQRLGFFKSVWNMVDFLMIVSSIASVAFYMIRSKNVLKSIKAIQANPYEIVHFHEALDWASLENASIAVAIFMVTLKLLNLIRFNPYVIYLFSSFRQSVGYQLSYVCFFLIVFNAFVVSGMQFFGGIVLEYSSYGNAVVSQFEFLLGRAVPLDDLRNEKPFIGPTFAFLYALATTIFMMNMMMSVLNESYTDAKTQAEECAEELEMARFIGERFMDMFQEGRNRTEFKLFCDDTTFVNMCRSDAEPNCLNSESILQCTEERLEKVSKRLSVLTRRAESFETEHLKEETEFLDLVESIASCQINIRPLGSRL